VQQRIERALVRNAQTDAHHIHVAVHDSRVTLAGSVRSYAERWQAERSAWSAEGITAVDNQITLEPVV
jgi:osmotically-inducible protein OsmY